MAEIRTIHYPDGRWCEQEYVDEKLHGRWTVFFANGQRDWERQLSHGRKEGYQRHWDETGRLVEEQWYHHEELHGLWQRWDDAGNVEVVGDFIHGYPREAFESTVNKDFNHFIKPYYGLEPAECEKQLDKILEGVKRPTLRILKSKKGKPDLSQPGSFWNHVNILGVGEEWPCYNGQPLFPILQIKCADIPLADSPLAGFSFITLFAVADDVLCSLGEDVVFRAYCPQDKIVLAKPPCESLDPVKPLVFSEETISYPDDNDLPPGLRVYLEESGDPASVLAQDTKLYSRIGGWPGWLQNGRLSGFGKFLFQVDSLDVENWGCGDCTVHYFFLKSGENGFDWHQEMC